MTSVYLFPWINYICAIMRDVLFRFFSYSLSTAFLIGVFADTSLEYTLLQNLTSPHKYDVNSRPVVNAQDVVDVKIDIGFQQIVSLDEPTQVLSTNIYLRLYWTDVSLQWDPRDHGNISSLHIYASRIWRPDITLYNDVGTSRREAEKLYPAIVTHEGNVTFLASAIFYTSCELDMTYFPWDSQACELELGSWSYDSHKLKLRTMRDSADTSTYIRNGEYDLVGVPARLKTQLYPCCPAPYETVIYTVKLKRKPMFYIINLVLPCIFVSWVGLLVFLLPPESGEKITLALTVLLASTVFLMIVAESIPPQSSTVPLISIYFEAVILLLALSSIITVLIINLHHRGSIHPRPPRIVRLVVLDWLARITCLRGLVERGRVDEMKSSSLVCTNKNGTKTSPNHNHMEPHSDLFHSSTTLDFDVKDANHVLLYEILQELRYKKREKETFGEGEGIVNEWVYVAMVLDRVFFIIFFGLSLTTTLYILIQ